MVSKKFMDRSDVESAVNGYLMQNITHEELRKYLKELFERNTSATGWLGYEFLTNDAKEYIAERLKELS